MSDSLLQRAVKIHGPEKVLGSLDKAQREALRFTWRAWARPEQLAPLGLWLIWLVLAGRGFGKTRTGAEFVREEVEQGRAGRIALVSPTAGDARDVLVEGDSGLLAISPNHFRPHYEPSKRRLTWPNGAQATTYSADEPDRLRGPQHDLAWCDEIAAWNYAIECWDMLMFGLRLGSPRACVTTTPKPVQIVRDLLKRRASDVSVTGGSTYENASNLAPVFLKTVRERYEGTRLGRQELLAELLDDVPGALWQRAQLDKLRVDKAPELKRVVIAVDPAVTNTEGSDETGIVAAGKGVDAHGYVLGDYSCRMSPDGWARRAVEAYHRHGAVRMVAEVNNGGDLVERVIRTVDPRVSFKAVRATRGKMVRAEPIAALDEQGKVHHVGTFAAMEDQMCAYTPDGYDGSPDRADARVWVLTELMLEGKEAGSVPGWRV